ncbi:MAG: hypothetical protein AAF922_01285 [Pseudomonadota bacterium]
MNKDGDEKYLCDRQPLCLQQMHRFDRNSSDRDAEARSINPVIVIVKRAIIGEVEPKKAKIWQLALVVVV